MNAYVHDQAIINERRMKEMEEQMKANEAAALAAATAAAAAAPAATDSSNLTPTPIETSISTTDVSPAELQNQRQSL